MKYLVIIATRDFGQLWNSQTDFIDTNRTLYVLERGEGRSEKPLTDFPSIITQKINGNKDFELGVIFHQRNDDIGATTLRSSLEATLNGKLAFCEWYSSNKTDFWNEQDTNADLPYNNLKKAWKDSSGDKEKTFEAVWDYFMVDPAIENPLKKLATSLPFDYVYHHDAKLRNAKNDLQKAVEQKLNR